MHEDALERISVKNRLPVGSETIINIRKDQLTISVKVNGFADIGMDDPVWIRFDSAMMNFYNPETENLIA